MMSDIPIITIDGLSSSGKSTISVLLAKKLGWNLLDSGLLYRAIAYLTKLEKIPIDNKEQIGDLTKNFELLINKASHLYRVTYKNKDITDYLNSEIVGKNASVVSKLPFIRDLRIMRQWTGVCDMSPDYSPIMGKTGIEGFYITTGWGTWGFKAIPVGGEQMAELIATEKTPELIAPFSLNRFAKDRTMADRGSAGTH